MNSFVFCWFNGCSPLVDQAWQPAETESETSRCSVNSGTVRRKVDEKIGVEVDITLLSPSPASPPNFQNRLELRVQLHHDRRLGRASLSYLAGAVVPLEVLHYCC